MYLPLSFPDELLFGRIIRYLTLSGEETSSFVEKVLSSRHTFHPTLTAGLSNIAKLTGGDVNGLLYEQTIAPVFMFYLPQHSRKLRQLLFGNDGNKALWESQLASFGQRHSCCLKWCPQCAADDIRSFGVSYWHRSHQIPGISVCYKHRQRLQTISLSSRQKLVRGLLPTLQPSQPQTSEVELRVAKFSNELLHIISTQVDTLNWAEAYRNKLDERGYITRGNQVRRQPLFDDLLQYVSSYPKNGDNPLPRNSKDYRYLSELLIPMSSHHPFRHLLFGSWLFESAEELFDYGLANKVVDVKDNEPEMVDIENRCLKLLRHGKSMAEIYRVTGKSRCYLKRIASINGIHLNLKPRKVTDDMKAQILRLAKLSMHREKISEICGISIGSVEQEISNHIEVIEWRRQCHFESKRRRCRLYLKRYISQKPNALRRDIKADCNAAFFWLYHNDKQWLDGVLPQATIPVGFGRYIKSRSR